MNQGSGTMDGRSLVDTVVGRAALSQYEGRQKERKLRRWKVAFLRVLDPPLGKFRSLKGVWLLCQLCIFLKRDLGFLRLGLFTSFYLVGHGCFTLLRGMDLSRCSEGFAGLACACILGSFGHLPHSFGGTAVLSPLTLVWELTCCWAASLGDLGVYSGFVERSRTLDGALVH